MVVHKLLRSHDLPNASLRLLKVRHPLPLGLGEWPVANFVGPLWQDGRVGNNLVLRGTKEEVAVLSVERKLGGRKCQGHVEVGYWRTCQRSD
jgi:hypothetical protein